MLSRLLRGNGLGMTCTSRNEQSVPRQKAIKTEISTICAVTARICYVISGGRKSKRARSEMYR